MTEATLKPGWRKWRFDQIATNVNERIDNPSESDLEYYVGLEHIDPDSLKLRRWGSPSDVESTKLIFCKGDIIFGKRRVYQRKVAVAEFDGICSAHALVLRAKPETVLPGLLPFFMQSNFFMERAKAISVGSLSPTINWKTLAKEEFLLPALEEQSRILALLATAEDVKQSTKDASDAGWQVRISAYKEITHRGQNNTKFQNSEIGKIPAHWEVLSIGEAVEIANKYRKPINADDRSKMQGPYPYFGPTGQLDSLNEYRLDGTYALIGEDGDHFLKYASWSMTQLISEKFNVNNHVHVIEGTDRCLTEWFFHYFRHYDIYRWLTKQGSGRLKLKKADLVEMPMAVPPIEEQKELVLVLDDLDKKTAVNLERRKLSAEAQLKSIQKRFFDG